MPAQCHELPYARDDDDGKWHYRVKNDHDASLTPDLRLSGAVIRKGYARGTHRSK